MHLDSTKLCAVLLKSLHDEQEILFILFSILPKKKKKTQTKNM